MTHQIRRHHHRHERRVEFESSTPLQVHSIRASPGRFVRHDEEKEEMIVLNDRLATFIDQVNQLESDKSRLEIEISSIDVTHVTEIESIKEMYERKLADERRFRAETAEENERLKIEDKKYKTELADLRPKVKGLEKDLNASIKRVNFFEVQMLEKDLKLHSLDDELEQVKKALGVKEKQLKDATKQVEAFRILRVNLENRIQSLEAELATEKDIIEELRVELRSRLVIVPSPPSSVDLDISLYDELTEARKQDQKTQWSGLKALAERLRSITVDEFTSELTKLKLQLNMKDQNDALIARIMDLEHQLRQERDCNLEAIQIRESELQELRVTVAQHIRDYEELLIVKLNLDKEIATYRVLLEGGEARMKRSLNQSEYEATTPPRKRHRHRGEDEARVTRTATTNGIVTIVDSDHEGNFVKLHNLSDTDQALGGWQLKRIVDGSELSYKFTKKYVLKKGGEVAVWASGSDDKVDNPPTDLVFRNTDSWGSGKNVETTLLDASGELVATCTEIKEIIHQESSEERGRCSLM